MVKVAKKAGVQQRAVDRCHRCGGLMVQEPVFEIGSIDWRCVSCGERIDPVILAHRQKNPGGSEADRLFVGHDKARFT